MHRSKTAIEQSLKLPGLPGEKTHARKAARAIHAAIEAIQADGCEVFDYSAEFCNNPLGEITSTIEKIFFTKDGQNYWCFGMTNYLNGHYQPYE